jgi:tetratricopeptide (TPR) repeat protein
VDKNRYFIGLIGLMLGFIISFVWTQRYNINNAPVAQAQGGANPHGAAGGGNSSMGDIQQVISNAKNNPKDFDAQIQAALAYAQINRNEGAIEYLENAYTADPAKFANLDKKDGQLYGASLFLGEWYLYEKSNYDGAEKWLKRAAEGDPNNAETLRHLVEAYAMKKDGRSAEEYLNRLKQLDPSHKKLGELQTLVSDVKAGKEVKLPEH